MGGVERQGRVAKGPVGLSWVVSGWARSRAGTEAHNTHDH
jgi:hypothetical protein